MPIEFTGSAPGGSGDVNGPASVTNEAIAVYDGTTGKLLKEGSKSIANLESDTQDVQDNLDTHIGDTSNPHAVTKAQVGLSSVSDDAQLKIASNLSDLASASSARSNLGLGSVAIESLLPIAKGGTNNTAFSSGLMPYFDGTKLADSAMFWDSATARLFVNAVASIGGSNAGIQYSDASTANRAQIKLHSYVNATSVAGVSTLTSRSGVIGTNAAVVAAQEYSKWTAQAGATTPGSAPISGNWAFIANTVNSLTVTSDFRIQLTDLAGTLGTRFFLGSEGAVQLPAYSVGIAHFDSSGNLTSSAVVLTSEVSGILPLANGGTNKNMTAVNGGIVWTDADSMEVSAAGSAGQILHSNGAAAPSFGPVVLSSEVSGVLPMANGGTNKNMTASAGAMAYSDADSLELSSVGATGQLLMSGGTGAPTWGPKWTSGTAATMYSTSGSDGDMFWNTSYKAAFIWIVDKWFPFGDIDSKYGGFKCDDWDSNTAVGQLNWVITNTSFVLAGEATHPGIVQLRQTAASARSALGLRTNSILLGTADHYIEAYVRIPTLATAGEDFVVTFGLNDNNAFDANGACTDGVFFSYNRAVNGANWIINTTSNTTATNTNTATAIVANTWYKLGILIRDGTSAQFFVDGVSQGTISTNIPTGTGRETGFQYKIDKTAGTGNSNLDIDSFTHWYFFNGGRA